jgi:hypothetical protein
LRFGIKISPAAADEFQFGPFYVAEISAIWQLFCKHERAGRRHGCFHHDHKNISYGYYFNSGEFVRPKFRPLSNFFLYLSEKAGGPVDLVGVLETFPP